MRRLMFGGLALGVCVLFGGADVRAQVVGFSDDFESTDPCTDPEWICYDVVRWVSPDDPWCDPVTQGEPDHSVDLKTDPQCNLFQDPEGYMLITPDFNDRGGSMFRAEALEYNNFKLTAEVELRGGHAKDNPADGMCIVIQGDAGNGPPAATGNLGGGMGAPGLADVAGAMLTPCMIFEFDNWDCNGSDQGANNPTGIADDNHVAFHYSPNGFVRIDDFQKNTEPGVPSNDAFRHIGPELNGVEYPPAGSTQSGKWLFEVFVQNGVVACNLTNTAVGIPKTRMYTYTIPDYESFFGYLGITASTGSANQNHILHSIRVDTLPPGFCLLPPFEAARDIRSPRTDVRQVTPLNPAGISVPVWRPGDVLDVDVTLSNIRQALPPPSECTVPTDVILTEVLPAGWTPSAISDGGVFTDATDTIRWDLGPAAIVEGKKLAYKITAVDNTFDAQFSGRLVEDIALAEPVGTSGDTAISKDSPFSACGGIRTWNILGPYQQSGFDNPGDTARQDFLTDGQSTELDFVFFPGAAIETDFGGASPSLGLQGNANGWNPGGVPTTIGWSDNDDFINVNDDTYGADPNNAMVYGQCYVINTTASDIEANMGVSSDDSVQVLFNEEEVWLHSIPRGGTSACAPQDHPLAADPLWQLTNTVIIAPGENRLIVKTFEGGGGFNFAFRFQDGSGNPLTQGLEIRLKPSTICVEPAFVATRDIPAAQTVKIQCDDFPRFKDGDTFNISIGISNPRPAAAPCSAPTTVVLSEKLPAGWTAAGASNGGIIDNVAGTITWTLNAPFPANVSYTATAVGDAEQVGFQGTFSDSGAEGKYTVAGDAELFNPSDFSTEGFIREWMLLGPYRQPPGPAASPGLANIQRDHLTDGASINEIDVEPRPGDTVNTAYGPAGPARSRGLVPPIGDGCSPPTTPTWTAWLDRDDTINFDNFYGGNIDNIMTYAVTYLKLETDLVADIGLGSDDSVQVLLDGVEIHINNIARGDGGANVVQDTIVGVGMEAGIHKLMVKIFEGGGGHTFRLRFQDPVTFLPITDGITICLDPDNCGDVVPTLNFRRGDTDGSKAVNITDMIRILNFLFAGGPAPTCQDTADTDDSGGLNITDGIYGLNFLFAGGRPIPAPGPSACGPDPTNDALPACVYNC